MLPLTTMTVTRPTANPWLASLYAGVCTAIFAAIFVLLFQAEIPVLYVIALLLTGVGPVLGYLLANGSLGEEWKTLIGGLIGGIPVLEIILWPVLVGALSRTQSIGKLFLANLIALILGVLAFLLLTKLLPSQDPSWLGAGFTIAVAVWGGACGAMMTAWRKL